MLDDVNARVTADWRRPQMGRGSPVVARKVDVEAMVGRWKAMKRG